MGDGAVDFTQDESNCLGEVAAELTPGLRRSVAAQFRTGPGPGAGYPAGAGQYDLPEQAVLTLDGNLSVVGKTASVAGWLRLLQPGPYPHEHVPAEVLNVAAQLLAREAGVDEHEAESGYISAEDAGPSSEPPDWTPGSRMVPHRWP
ncbi:hypothetical protein QF031_002583 [Pseudarthrobacter defluvii]|uniref:hypothetical protein n=1 Tax=Pseudarthrobacter defluvii TaxID=410837 RepID=UPI0027814B4C|nr:hypothetical protein [Pseudarthrobacter defluvii]MDQ0769834.1 hypothetical protein [Pseudarthrobacter defluvii]